MIKNYRVQPVDNPRDFDVQELFFSITDRKGVIRGCNEVFTRIAGFEPHKILDQPHNIIRHPHMPRAVFKLLWDYILDGRPVGAYVKNMAETGEYYWVFALVVPVDNEFLSIRLKPTSHLLPAVEALYAKTLKYELTFGDDWRQGMVQSGDQLLADVVELGYESYDDFMTQALDAEIKARREQINSRGSSAVFTVQPLVEIEPLVALRRQLVKTNTYFETLCEEVRYVATNARIVAARLKEGSETLGVISREVSEVAGDIRENRDALDKEVDGFRNVLYACTYSVSYLALLREMEEYFDDERARNRSSEEEQRQNYGRSLSELSTYLRDCVETAERSNADSLRLLEVTLGQFRTFVRQLANILLTLQFGYVTGKSITAIIENGHEFALLLESMLDCSRGATDQVNDLKAAIVGVERVVFHWRRLCYSGASILPPPRRSPALRTAGQF
ncbi:MAG: PAS domain-containing protein [Gammaproteobacteria bacterium]